MPRTKNAMSRYKILDDLLRDRYHCYTLDSLTEIVGERLVAMGQEPVTRRQIEKDIQYIEYGSEFLAEIERYKADGEACFNKQLMKTVYRQGLRYADPSFSIFSTKLSEDEKNLLRDLLSIVGQFDGLPNLEALEDMRQRLQLGENTKCISLSHNPLAGKNIFGLIYSAITHKQVIKLTYHTHRAPEESHEIMVSPYMIKEYNRRWFLICAAKSDNKILNFALDQIDSVKQCQTANYVEYQGDLNERYEDIVGVTYNEGQPVEHIVFWVSDSSQNYVRTKPIHESQKTYTGDREQELRLQFPSLIGGKFFSVDCIVNYELIRELMSHAKELLVIEPSTLKEEIMAKLSNNLRDYENL